MMRTLNIAFCASALLASFGMAASAQMADVMLTPAVVVAGSPELISVHLPASETVNGEWLGNTLQFFRGRDGRAWYALAGVDVQTQTGPSNLQISARTPAGATVDLGRTVEILPAHYRTSTLTVAPKFVEPGPDELTRIKAERALKDKVFASSAARAVVVRRFSRAGACTTH